ncbi:MAG TPA: response regulator [Myxococcota bacterium]|nr:response regulator [Myxococcota bacterium]HRY94957.1 response regulator [Myxococcota bacterium]HSA19980.1 response regulator [Myxococcota bacterium]
MQPADPPDRSEDVPEAAATAKAWEIEEPPKDFYEILVVDDDETTRKLLRSILKAHGYLSVDEAGDGSEALAALKAKEYDLVLLDKNMPGLDGLEVLRQGKALWPLTEFIVITAYGSMESAIQAMDLGAFSYVTKPFTEIAAIVKRIEAAIERGWVRNQNKVLADHLRMLSEDLHAAELRLAALKAGPAPAQEPDSAARVAEAVARLQQLVAELEKLRASGKAAEVFRMISRELGNVVDLLLDQESVGPL